MSTDGGTKAVLAAAGANLAIAALKFGAFALTGASSLLAEGIHSVADTGNQALLLFGGRKSRQEATREHPFGFGGERYVSGFLVSVVLFSLGGLFALYEAYEKLHDVMAGHEDPLLASRWWWVPIVILGAAAIAEGLSFRTAVHETNRSRGRQTLLSYIRGAKAPELPVVLLEDSAALLGLVFALAGVVLTLVTRNGIFDVIATALIGLLLVVVAVVLFFEMRSLLVGESASEADQSAILRALEDTDGVDRVIHSRTLHLGPDEILLAAKIAVPAADSVAHVGQVIDGAERSVREAVPAVRYIYLEPDVDRGLAQ